MLFLIFFTSIAVPFLMYVEGGFINNIGLTGVVFPNSAMWSLQVKVTVYETMSKGGLISEESIFTLVPSKMWKITIHPSLQRSVNTKKTLLNLDNSIVF